ncbi:MAG: class I SAM-dependent methyltransferase [Phycisphaerales bacterium]|nr:class I SAM-dependent methyltransferase [Phycisphaerales bacterium]
MSSSSRKYHDRVARQYDTIYDDPYWHFHDELTWRMIKPHLPRDHSLACLDLGCGTGKWGLKLLKSGFATTFVDHSAAMVEQVRRKLEDMGSRAGKATLLAADMIKMPELPNGHFALTVAMGDPLSICSDPQAAANEMFRITRAGGVVVATADNKLAALDHYVQRGNLQALEAFVQNGRTRWLTSAQEEQFELTTFTPESLKKLFERAGFAVSGVAGKTILPLRHNKRLLEAEDAILRLLQLEKQLAKDAAAAGRCAHLQITAVKPIEAT